jgi:hypothetical protein
MILFIAKWRGIYERYRFFHDDEMTCSVTPSMARLMGSYVTRWTSCPLRAKYAAHRWVWMLRPSAMKPRIMGAPPGGFPDKARQNDHDIVSGPGDALA